MSRITAHRTTLAVAATAALSVGLLAPVNASAAPTSHDRALPSQIALPAGFQPEGIATGPNHKAYLGSRADGDIYRMDLRTGRGRVISQGPGTPSMGLKLDPKGRLFVAGGSAGDARVVNSRTGKVIRSYHLVTGTSCLNDVVLTKRAAYVTDSANAQVFKLPLGRNGKLPRAGQVKRIPLTGAWVQGLGNNANGITTVPRGRALLVVNSSNGTLYRVASQTGKASVVDLSGYAVTAGDGLLREGRRLYVVQNRLNQIAVIRLNSTGTRGHLVKTLTSPRFDVPSTVARSGQSLYLPNARFTTPPTPTTAYDVTRVAAPKRS
jgi:sugar lactone lactonase YvrE